MKCVCVWEKERPRERVCVCVWQWEMLRLNGVTMQAYWGHFEKVLLITADGMKRNRGLDWAPCMILKEGGERKSRVGETDGDSLSETCRSARERRSDGKRHTRREREREVLWGQKHKLDQISTTYSRYETVQDSYLEQKSLFVTSVCKS